MSCLGTLNISINLIITGALDIRGTSGEIQMSYTNFSLICNISDSIKPDR